MWLSQIPVVYDKQNYATAKPKPVQVNSGALGVLYFISNFVQAGANISAAKLARMMSAHRAIVVSLGLSALFYMMIPLAPSFAWIFIPYIVRFGLFNLSVPLVTSLFMKLVDDDERATANSVANMASMGGNIVGSMLSGQLMGKISLDIPAYLGSGLCIVEAATFHFLFKNTEKRPASNSQILKDAHDSLPGAVWRKDRDRR